MTAISPEIRSYICEKLDRLAKAESVKILLAIESGSRAWGFPSSDSDYDVRFIYARRENDYLSIIDHRDVIETPVQRDDVLDSVSDLNGWDIRKALQLALKSNAVINEWARSPVLYAGDTSFRNDLLVYIGDVFDGAAFAYHYDRMARRTYEKIVASGDDVRLKDYCYALRAGLSLFWLEHHSIPPPMDMTSLLHQPGLVKGLLTAVHELLAEKATAKEAQVMKSVSIFDKFLSEILSKNRVKSDGNISQKNAEKADEIFRRYVR